MNTCEMAVGFYFHGDFAPENCEEPIACGRPAGIKREGIWLCAEHFDFLEAGGPTNWIAQGDRWIPIKIHTPTQLKEFSS